MHRRLLSFEAAGCYLGAAMRTRTRGRPPTLDARRPDRRRPGARDRQAGQVRKTRLSSVEPRRPSLTRSLPCLLAVILIPACEAAPPPRLGELAGRVLAPDPVLVVPDRSWSGGPDADGWVAPPDATLLVLVSPTAVSGEAHLLVRPAVGATVSIQRADGQSVATMDATQGTAELPLPLDWMRPGINVLTLRGEENATLRIATLGLRHGNTVRRIVPADSAWSERLAIFLTRGVIPDGGGRHTGGFATLAGATAHARVTTPTDTSLRVLARNNGTETARFTLETTAGIAAVDLAPGEERPLEAAVTPGTTEVTFRAGAETQFAFWAMPHLQRVDHGLPSVVVMTLDTTRRDALTPYGAPPDRTPYLDGLARRATVYSRAWATAPWTLPAHASIFTGQPPSAHGAGVTATALRPDARTLAAELTGRGYLTAGFSGGPLTRAAYGVARGFDYYVDADRPSTPGDLLTRRVLDFVDGTPARPLFLFVNYFDAHLPYRTPPGAGVARSLEQLHEDLAAALRADDPVPQDLVADLRGAYAAQVRFMDRELGRLVDGLEDRGVLDGGLLVVLGDHGELLGERGRFLHSMWLDPELVGIPLIVRWPDQSRPSRSEVLTSQTGLFESVLATVDGRASGGPGTDPLAAMPEARQPFVMAEEHSQERIHPLPPDNPGGYAALGSSWVRVERGNEVECFRRLGESWRMVPCDGRWTQLLHERVVELRQRLRPLSLEMPDPEEIGRLRDLGYIH